MPLSEYFKGKGKTVMSTMQKEYGADKGEQVFYATVNKKKKKKTLRDMIGADGESKNT